MYSPVARLISAQAMVGAVEHNALVRDDHRQAVLHVRCNSGLGVHWDIQTVELGQVVVRDVVSPIPWDAAALNTSYVLSTESGCSLGDSAATALAR